MRVNFAKSLNATLIGYLEVAKIDRKLKDLAKLPKHAEEEPFLDDAEHDLLALVYACRSPARTTEKSSSANMRPRNTTPYAPA